jgi:predicted permease
MDWIRIILSRVAALCMRQKLDDDLDEELSTHIEFAVEENLRCGMSKQEARTAALREFGGLRQTKEAYRVQRGLPFLEQMVRDLRFGLRQLHRSPGFAITAILTLALGLGANTAVFSLINGLLLRPLPVPHADQLALLHYDRSDQMDRAGYSFTAPVFRALEKRHDVFQDVAAFTGSSMQVSSGTGNLEIPGVLVSGQFFHALQVQPAMGRYLTPEDDRVGGGTSGFDVVISDGFWRTWFNDAPDVVGRSLTIANAQFTVVGVMPKQFIGADPMVRPEIYVPLSAEPLLHAPYNNIACGYRCWWLRVIARRNTGVSLMNANAELLAISSQILDEAIPDSNWIKNARNSHFQIEAEPGSKGYTYLRSTFKRPLVAVFSLCGAMLLLACLNLASLLMARAAARERELATRLAIGATRKRLIQQLLVETLLISILGTAVGLAVSPVVSRSLAVLMVGNDRNAILDTSLDLRVFLFAALIAGIATLLIGFVPALRATSGNLNDHIKDGSHATSAREWARLLPRILMGLEVALALILMVGAGLLATSLTRLYRTGLGFDPNNLVNLDLAMGKQKLDGDALLRWYQAFADSLARQPSVKSVSFAGVTPLTGDNWTDDLRTSSSNGDRNIYWNTVAPQYFETMRIPMLGGRDFKWSDMPASGKKIILNQTAVKILFPGQNAIGQRVTGAGNKSYEVIAVVGDVRYATIRRDAPAGAFVPITQSDDKKPSYTTVVRVKGSGAPLASAARLLAARMTPEIPAPVMTTMSADLEASIISERMMAMLSVFFAGCALFVTTIGLYGTLAYATARRTSEIGIRMALGAQRAQVVVLVFRENAWIAVSGSCAGLGMALLASRALASFLYGTSVRDPWVLAGSVLALISMASGFSSASASRGTN